jgi:hypothetical protein
MAHGDPDWYRQIQPDSQQTHGVYNNAVRQQADTTSDKDNHGWKQHQHRSRKAIFDPRHDGALPSAYFTTVLYAVTMPVAKI